MKLPSFDAFMASMGETAVADRVKDAARDGVNDYADAVEVSVAVTESLMREYHAWLVRQLDAPESP